MAERALRGTRLGARSYENDAAVDFAPRQMVAFDCPQGHRFEVPFSVEADLPRTWECRVCGATAIRVDAGESEAKAVKPPRTHWDMLLERRSVDDLEVLLAERLALIRDPQPAGRKSA
jgi:hypothetical protein